MKYKTSGSIAVGVLAEALQKESQNFRDLELIKEAISLKDHDVFKFLFARIDTKFIPDIILCALTHDNTEAFNQANTVLEYSFLLAAIDSGNPDSFNLLLQRYNLPDIFIDALIKDAEDKKQFSADEKIEGYWNQIITVLEGYKTTRNRTENGVFS